MTVYILGGGPTGLATAHGLTESPDVPFVLLERSSSLGGLAQTVAWSSYGLHDLGPHKIFTLNQDLMKKVRSLLEPEDWLTRPKTSSIFLEKCFLPYPPSPFSLIHVYGLKSFIGMTFDYASARANSLVSKNDATTFEEDLQGRVGSKIYEALFEPIAKKLWGHPSSLDVKLSRGRVQTPSLLEIIKRFFKLSKSSEFEALEFYYPKGGLQKIWNSIVKETEHQGKYVLNAEIIKLIVANDSVSKIIYRDRLTKEEKSIKIREEDWVFSTLPLTKLTELMGDGIPESMSHKIGETIKLNDLSLVFLKIDKSSLFDESWIFVPDSSIPFHRVSEQESFDPEMTPHGSIVCCEFMGSEIRNIQGVSDDRLIELAIKGLQDMGYKDFSVVSQRVIRLPSSYPVFKVGFEPILEDILNYLDRFKNFKTIGRQGAFNYIGTLDAMDIGYGAARWLLNGNESLLDSSWQKERQRTNHYPVLD